MQQLFFAAAPPSALQTPLTFFNGTDWVLRIYYRVTEQEQESPQFFDISPQQRLPVTQRIHVVESIVPVSATSAACAAAADVSARTLGNIIYYAGMRGMGSALHSVCQPPKQPAAEDLSKLNWIFMVGCTVPVVVSVYEQHKQLSLIVEDVEARSSLPSAATTPVIAATAAPPAASARPVDYAPPAITSGAGSSAAPAVVEGGMVAQAPAGFTAVAAATQADEAVTRVDYYDELRPGMEQAWVDGLLEKIDREVGPQGGPIELYITASIGAYKPSLVSLKTLVNLGVNKQVETFAQPIIQMVRNPQNEPFKIFMQNLARRLRIALPHVTVVGLSLIGIRDLSPHTFDGFPRLKRLDLFVYSKLYPDTFIGLYNLKELSISGGAIYDIYPGAFNGLVSLEELSIRCPNSLVNGIRDPNTFAGIPSLKRLIMQDGSRCGESRLNYERRQGRIIGSPCKVRELQHIFSMLPPEAEIWVNVERSQ